MGLIWKNWAHQNFTTSQDNSNLSIDLGKKAEKTYRLDQACATYIAAGIGCVVESAGHGIKSNPATYCHLIHDISSIIATVTSSMPLLPNLCNHANMYR